MKSLEGPFQETACQGTRGANSKTTAWALYRGVQELSQWSSLRLRGFAVRFLAVLCGSLRLCVSAVKMLLLDGNPSRHGRMHQLELPSESHHPLLNHP
jgi:hypothetical protein